MNNRAKTYLYLWSFAGWVVIAVIIMTAKYW